MVSSSLRFQRCRGFAKGIQPVLAALQHLGQLIATLAVMG